MFTITWVASKLLATRLKCLTSTSQRRCTSIAYRIQLKKLMTRCLSHPRYSTWSTTVSQGIVTKMAKRQVRRQQRSRPRPMSQSKENSCESTSTTTLWSWFNKTNSLRWWTWCWSKPPLHSAGVAITNPRPKSHLLAASASWTQALLRDTSTLSLTAFCLSKTKFSPTRPTSHLLWIGTQFRTQFLKKSCRRSTWTTLWVLRW